MENQIVNFVKFIPEFEDSNYIDTEGMKQTLNENYEQFESSMDKEEFDKWVQEYVDDAETVGDEAYKDIPLKEFLEDFKLYVQNA